jgi:ubiquinone/menaquinone biosynthesis C-methylase UbiE
VSTAPYHELADRYAQHRRPSQPIVDRLVARAGIGSTATVLEVGCGTANHLAGIHQRTGARCEGVDPSAQMLCHAAQHDVDLILRQGRAEELSLPAGTYKPGCGRYGRGRSLGVGSATRSGRCDPTSRPRCLR